MKPRFKSNLNQKTCSTRCSNERWTTEKIGVSKMTISFKYRIILTMLAIGALAVGGCRGGSQSQESSSSQPSSCLTDTKLVDQNGNNVTLASLKGKPIVVDFIYTSCPGTCLMETAKLANVALRLGPELGSKVSIVSITVDPEHDGPKQLLDYSRQQGADEKGWYFLTGSPADVDSALGGFKVIREKEPDGSVTHIVSMFLVGPDGREIREYNGEIVKPANIVNDVNKLTNG
jgi:protein SCO1